MKNKLQIQIYDLKIPFLTSFRHTSATRTVTQTIITEVTDGAFTGFGEGCPREYVTGESIQSAFIFLNSIKESLINSVNSLDELNQFRYSHTSQIEKNFAAWCSIELAYLDFFGRKRGKILEELLNTDCNSFPTRYSAIIGNKPFKGFEKDVNNYSQFGFKDFKLKLSGNTEDDYRRLKYIKKAVPEATIRVDANNLWNNIEDAKEFVLNVPCNLIGIEEPLTSKQLDELVELSKTINCKIILDESFKSIEDLKIIQEHSGRFILNLRVSKQGGLLNSLEIAEACIAGNIELIIGAQVGETAILTRSSIALARCLKGNVRIMEGAFGTLFLTEDLTNPSLQFGKNGLLNLEDFILSMDKGNQLNISTLTINKFSHRS